MLVNSSICQSRFALLKPIMKPVLAGRVSLRPWLLSALCLGVTLGMSGCSSNAGSDSAATSPKSAQAITSASQDNNTAPQALSAPVDRGPELSAADAASFANANAAIKAARYADAAALLTPLAARYPQAAGVHYNLALAVWQQQPQSDAQQAAASRILQTIVQRRPDHVASLNLWAVLLRQQGQFQQAVTLWQQLIAQDANHAQAHKNLAFTAELYLHDKALAIKHYQAYQALTADPKAATWLGILGVNSQPAAADSGDAGAADDGATNDGAKDNGAADDGASGDGATDDGATDDSANANSGTDASATEVPSAEPASAEPTLEPSEPAIQTQHNSAEVNYV